MATFQRIGQGLIVTTETKLHVFVNLQKVDIERQEMTGEELLREAGFAGNEWDLLLLRGEGDPTGGELIMFTESLQLKNGLHFRVIPGNRTFGA